MPQIFGLDRLRKVIPVGIYSSNPSSPGAMAVRQIIDDANSIVFVTNFLAMGVGTQTNNIYTVPAGFIFELSVAGHTWFNGGTATFNFLMINRAGNQVIVAGNAGMVLNSPLLYQGKIFMIAGDIVQSRVNVTVAGVSVQAGVTGTLWPQP